MTVPDRQYLVTFTDRGRQWREKVSFAPPEDNLSQEAKLARRRAILNKALRHHLKVTKPQLTDAGFKHEIMRLQHQLVLRDLFQIKRLDDSPPPAPEQLTLNLETEAQGLAQRLLL